MVKQTAFIVFLALISACGETNPAFDAPDGGASINRRSGIETDTIVLPETDALPPAPTPETDAVPPAPSGSDAGVTKNDTMAPSTDAKEPESDAMSEPAADTMAPPDTTPPPAPKPEGDWLTFNMASQGSCMCTADGWRCQTSTGSWTILENQRTYWYEKLAELCDGKDEGDSCSGNIPSDGQNARFYVAAGTCRQGGCCAGCWDGKKCRVTFQWAPANSNSIAMPVNTWHKQWDLSAAPNDWRYTCGSRGEECKVGMGDQEGQRLCGRGNGASDTCPENILP